MGETELKVINLFKQNPTLSITQVAEKLDFESNCFQIFK